MDGSDFITYDFNIILKEVGRFGLFQKLIIFVAFLGTIPGASNISAGVYLSFLEESRCSIPTDVNASLLVSHPNHTMQGLARVYLPVDHATERVSECARFSTEACGDGTDVGCMIGLHNSGLLTHPHNTTSCATYWHSRRVFTETTATEWDLTCGNTALNSLSTSMFCLGMLIGAICGGVSADRFGRKKTWFFSTAFAGIFGCLCSISPSFYVFVFLRFMVGAFVSSVILCVVVHTMEFVGEKYRPLVGLQVGVFSGLGYMNLAMLAYWFRHWRQLQLVLGCSFFPFLLIIPFIPESPRYLFQCGNRHRGRQVCNLIAKVNGVEIDETLWEKSKTYEEKLQTYTPSKIFTKPPLFRMLLNCFALNFMNSLVFFFLSFNVGAWFGDPFLNQSLSGLVELVACLVAVPVAFHFGRRTINVVCLFIAGSLLVVTEVLKWAFSGQAWVKTAEVFILLVAKLAASPSFNLLFLYVAELFPTSVRYFMRDILRFLSFHNFFLQLSKRLVMH